MTRARDIANLVDSNGDIVAGALDNVPAADLVNDTTPQLGGALDAQSNNINSVGELGVGTAAGSIPSGVGVHIASSTSDPYLYVNGSGGNRDCGIKINSGGSVVNAFRLNSGGELHTEVGSSGTWYLSEGSGNHRIVANSERVEIRRSATQPSGAQNVNSNATLVLDSGLSEHNLLQFRQNSDNGYFQGLVFSDNNQGGSIVHGNGQTHDGLRIQSYSSGIELRVGGSNTTNGLAFDDRRLYVDDASNTRISETGTKTQVGANVSGLVMKWNDDLWFSDPQNGQIYLRNGGDNNWGTISGFLNNQSDRNDKTNIEVLTDEMEDNVADTIADIDVNLYNFRGDPEGKYKRIGPMAQDMPLYCAGSENKTNLNSAAMDGALMAALKSALRKISQLESRVAALENA